MYLRRLSKQQPQRLQRLLGLPSYPASGQAQMRTQPWLRSVQHPHPQVQLTHRYTAQVHSQHTASVQAPLQPRVLQRPQNLQRMSLPVQCWKKTVTVL